jgi:hypothetical protein
MCICKSVSVTIVAGDEEPYNKIDEQTEKGASDPEPFLTGGNGMVTTTILHQFGHAEGQCLVGKIVH